MLYKREYFLSQRRVVYSYPLHLAYKDKLSNTSNIALLGINNESELAADVMFQDNLSLFVVYYIAYIK